MLQMFELILKNLVSHILLVIGFNWPQLLLEILYENSETRIPLTSILCSNMFFIYCA